VRSSDDAGAPFSEFEPWRDNDKIEGYPVNNKHILSPPLVEEQGQVEPHLQSLLPILSSLVHTLTPDDNRTPPRSPPPSVGKAANLSATIVQDLVTEFQKLHTCSRAQHKLELWKHLHKVQNYRFVRSRCSSLYDLCNLVDLTVASNKYIPHLLSQPDIYRNRQHKALLESDLNPASANPADFTTLPNNPRFGHLFKGQDNDTTPPYNTCLHLHEQSRLGRPVVFSTDINSVCGFAQSLGFCQKGIDWYPRPHRVRNITTNLHRVYMRTYADLESEGDHSKEGLPVDQPAHMLRKISEIHQIAFGRVFSGLLINIFILFLNLYSHRNKTSEPTSNFLTNKKECLWTDGVFLPSLIECLPSYLFTEVPGSWRVATANSLANSSKQAVSSQKMLK
jgi:hypothetical protein